MRHPRQRARENIEQGPITSAYGADRGRPGQSANRARALTAHGHQKAERLARALADFEEQALQALTDTERVELDALLAKLLDGQP